MILITLNIDYLRYDTADKAATVSALQQADVLITLSQAMNQQLLLDGVNVPMVVLDLHDYLSEGEILPATYMKKLIFAGSPYKATYMQGWQSHIPIDIFAREEAIDHIDQLHDSISYTGYLTPDKMPNLISYGFGLAFDVDSDAGHFANYQTLNLSHHIRYPCFLQLDCQSLSMLEQHPHQFYEPPMPHLSLTVLAILKIFSTQWMTFNIINWLMGPHSWGVLCVTDSSTQRRFGKLNS